MRRMWIMWWINGEVVIVDEFTGRLMHGRRYSDGLHQAIEAKEGLEVQQGKHDAGHHHLSKLLPHVQEIGRHDRDGQNGRGRAAQNLRP